MVTNSFSDTMVVYRILWHKHNFILKYFHQRSKYKSLSHCSVKQVCWAEYCTATARSTDSIICRISIRPYFLSFTIFAVPDGKSSILLHSTSPEGISSSSSVTEINVMNLNRLFSHPSHLTVHRTSSSVL